MAETQNNLALLHRKEWQTMTPCPVASAIATSVIFSKNGANNVALVLSSGTVHYLYHHDEDAYIQIPSGAFGGTWVAGAAGVFHPWSRTYTATGGSTTTVTVSAASFNLNGFVRGEIIEFLSGTAANVGVRTTISEILNNAGQGTITLTLSSTLASPVANNDTFRIRSGRFFVMASGTLAAKTFQEFDIATMTWTDKAYAVGTAGGTNATDSRLVVPYMTTAIFDTGTGTAASNTTTLVDTSKNWTASQWVNYQVRITAGTGRGQVRVITANDATSLTFASGIDLDETSVYAIEGDENAIYYLGNGAVTLFKYSISDNTWATVTPTANRASAPLAGMTADWVGVTGDVNWGNPNNCLDGRYIYSMRPTSGIIDRYDISSRAWLPTTGVNYRPTTTLSNGGSSFWDGRYIYLMVPGTATVPCRFFKYSVSGNYVEPLAEDWYLGGAAVAGNKMWIKDLSSTGTIKWLYYLSGTSNVVRRMMLI